MKVELVTNLKRQATRILADLHMSKEPVLITEHGKPSAYLVDVQDTSLCSAVLSCLKVSRVGSELYSREGLTASARPERK